MFPNKKIYGRRLPAAAYPFLIKSHRMVLSWHLRDSTVDDDSLLHLWRCPGSWMNGANGVSVAVICVVFDGVVIGLTHSSMIVALVDVVTTVVTVSIGETVIVDAKSRVVLVVTGCRNVAGHGHHHNPSQKQNLINKKIKSKIQWICDDWCGQTTKERILYRCLC